MRVQHPKVKNEQIIVRVDFPNPTPKYVLVIYVDMPLFETEDGFDPEAFKELVEAVNEAVSDAIDEAEIRRVGE